MKAVGLLAVCALSCAARSHAADRGVIVSYFEPLQRLQIEKAVPGVARKIGDSSPLTLRFDALGRTFDLRLEPNSRLLSDASRQALTGEAAAYRGTIANDADSWARIVIAGGIPRGLIWDGEQLFAVEAPGDSSVQSSLPVIYRLADAHVDPGTMSCGTSASPGNAAVAFDKLTEELAEAVAEAPGAILQIDLGAVGDFEFFGDKGDNAEAAILTRMNNVDGIYSEQLGVQIQVAELEVFSASDDPFTDATDASVLLNELAAYRFGTPAQRSQGLTHLFTGRNLDENTVGIAFTDTLCQPRVGAGLTQSGNDATFDSLVAAHEIGHNFGAPHDGDPEGACAAVRETFLMAPSANGSDRFSQCSIDQIRPNIEAAACISPLPSVDMTIALSGTLAPVLLGNRTTVIFDASNNGTEQATAVTVDITVPDNVSLESATASDGTCTAGAGTVNCQIGSVAGSSNRMVTLSATAIATGSGNFVATVSADADDNPDNNEATVPLTVEPAVDLVVHAIAAAEVNLNRSASIRADLENRSVLEATAVGLSISLDSGLRAESATWSLGSCAVTAQQIDCESDTFAALAAATLDIVLTGTTAGPSSYDVSLSASEADANTADNSASGTVTVTEPAAANTTGGGGATGFLSLLALVVTILRRRRFQRAYRRMPASY